MNTPFIDLEQTSTWAQYMQDIGQEIITIDDEYIYKVKTPLGEVFRIYRPQKIKFEVIEDIIRKYNPFQILYVPHPYTFEQDKLDKNDFHQDLQYFVKRGTSLISLEGRLEDIVKKFSKTARYTIKHETVCEVKIIESPTQNDFENFYTMYSKPNPRKKYYKYPRQQSEGIFKASGTNSIFINAYLDNELISSAWFIKERYTCIYFSIALNHKAYQYETNYAQLFKGIEYAQNQGCTVLDLMGYANPQYPDRFRHTEGFTNFKKHFHGQLVFYPPPYIRLRNKRVNTIYGQITKITNRIY